MALTVTHNYDLAYVGFTKQTGGAAGTAVAPTKFCRWQTIPAMGELMKIGKYRDGNSRDWSIAEKEGQWHKGTFTSMIFPDTTVDLLFGFMCGLGAAEDAISGAGDPYTHVFSENAAGLMPFFSFEHSMGYQNEVLRVTDCLIDGFKLTGKANGATTIQWDYLGRIAVPKASPTAVAFEVDRPMTFADATLTFDAGLSIVSADVTEFVITGKNTVAPNYGHGSVSPAFLLGNAREFAFECTFFAPDNKALRDIFHGGDAATTIPNAPTYEGEFTVIWDLAGSPDHSVQIELYNIVMELGTPSYSVDAKAWTCKASGVAIRQPGASMCTVTALNLFATAYSA